ncbi:hypothetical protein [Nocardioides sp.]|uniref:hypothetical protein n=1 Tax=Nocardioides sp. TaxID=35761 RepID=UPI002B270812|nr:hypothetical protein [Nocardioides sp.]
MQNRANNVVAAAAVASGLFAVGAAAVANDGTGNPQGRGESVAARAAEGVTRCDGGRHINLKTRINSTPFTFSETGVDSADQQVPGMVVTFRGPRRGTDAFLVTFSAESQLNGANSSSDWMGIETHLDGTPIQPYTAAGDVYAFTSTDLWQSNSAQFCVRVGKGKHQLRVQANLHDGASDSTLSGWLDDATMSVLRFD